ncbi:hypothetical protein [Streptomyces griseoruber]|uniref:hypothetical protein n=1 Tax=Streptomyces griseoruber TaxID=1943 RepID=UPI0037A824F3
MSLPVPADLSLASFDSCFLAKIRHLLLTSVDIGAHEVGRRVTRAPLDWTPAENGSLTDPRS